MIQFTNGMRIQQFDCLIETVMFPIIVDYIENSALY